MFALLSPIDCGVLVLVLAAMVAIGVYFSGKPRNAEEFLAPGRLLGWRPLALSMGLTLAASVSLTDVAALAYAHGLKTWIVPASFWLILPIMVVVVVPIYRGLALDSLFEYLQHRFDARVRRLASSIYIVCRLLWLAAVAAALCRAAVVAAGGQIPVWAAIGLVTLIATSYVYLGGFGAVVWTGVVQTIVILAGSAAVIAAVWIATRGGPARVIDVASHLGRLQGMDAGFRWADPWTIWGAAPHWLVISLLLCVADQVTVQRLLFANDVNHARTSYLAAVMVLTLLVLAAGYIGVCLLAFYHDHPSELMADWVANLDGATRQPIDGSAGRPLLDPRNPAEQITPQNVERLIAQRRILDPNDKQPFTSTADVVDPVSGRILAERLAMFRPQTHEAILGRGADEQLWPHFIATRLSWGAAGLAVGGFLGAALALIGAGQHAIATLLTFEFRRRQPLPVVALAKEVRLARALTLVVGLALAALSIGVAAQDDGLHRVTHSSIACASPLAALMLLGMLTRRATASAAFIGVMAGVVLTSGLEAQRLLSAEGAGPPRGVMIETWAPIFGFSLTFAIGLLFSFIVGRKKSSRDLRGLVLGCGKLGMRASAEVVPIFEAD